MNERIKLLANQALDEVVPYTWTTLNYEEIQKLQKRFAELIVRECANQCESATQMGQPLHLVSLGYAQRIKEHFGL